jgi:outer membrane protein OmpA-like peptidoglycan-associated protein
MIPTANRFIFSLGIFLLGFALPTHAQIESWTVGAYTGPSLYRGDLSQDNLGTMRGGQLLHGIQATYRLRPSWELGLRLQHGQVEAADHFFPDDSMRQLRDLVFRTRLTDLALLVHFTPFAAAEPALQPELGAGFGFVWFQPRADFTGNAIIALNEKIKEDQLTAYLPNSPIIPLRAGLRWQPLPHWSVRFGFQYNLTFTDYLDGISKTIDPGRNDHYGLAYLGLQYVFRQEDLDGDGVPDDKDACKLQPGPPQLQGCPDADGDGIPDAEDQCPLAKGRPDLDGCPDTDGDTVPDPFDRCPAVAGAPEAAGCPVVDTDGDGIENHLDKCPLVAGPANRQGCPAIDTDGDGLLDEDDRCPQQYGVMLFQGCPDTDGDGIADSDDACPSLFGVIAAQGCPLSTLPEEEAQVLSSQLLLFAPGSTVITNYQLLDRVVNFLRAHPEYRAIITGHADSNAADAPADANSEARARAVFRYLTQQGIPASRLRWEGLGSTHPIGAATTLAGSRQNRRVEMRLYRQ